MVPPLEHKYLPYDWGSYSPTWVEITITFGTFMGMILLYVLFAKFVPIISIWELKGPQHSQPIAEAAANATVNPAIRLDNTLPSTNG